MTSTETPSSEHRLPTTARPRHYDLELAPDVAGATFSGTVRIHLDVAEPVDALECHAAELEIGRATVEVDGVARPARVELDEERERCTIRVVDGTGAPETITAGEVVVELAFAGVLNDKLRGFYRSVAVDAEGGEHPLAVTQFEATDARRAFPCWDEPAFKASFSVALVVNTDHLAVSNGPEVGRDVLDDGRVRVRFGPTMPMSTYLVAFVVGPLATTRAVDAGGVPLRVVCTPDRLELAEFALEAGAFALDWFARYYDIPYPGDKLDLVAVPDFAFGAMENLGCVIFRETLLLVDPATATQSELLAVVDVIAHELAHMWFGDLVTMEWWNGIWLNEAFATFMEMRCTDAYRPEWERWMTFGRERTAAFEVDALASTRPIEYPVVTPADAEAMFDVLTYQKGSAVVRMLEQYLGPDRFRSGINRYLRTHRYANTDTGDLWDALEAETDEPVRALMDSWIFQGGFPLVGVRRSGTGLELTQRRFGHGSDDGGPAAWQVPVVVRAGAVEHRHLLREQHEVVEGLTPPVVVNAGGHGFYRVDYEPALRAGVVERLGALEPLERYSFLDDTLALVLAGDLVATDLVDVLTSLVDTDEGDLAVWQLGGVALDVLVRAVTPADRRTVSDWSAALLAPLSTRLGPDVEPGDADRTRALRGLVLGQRGADGDPASLERARALFPRFVSAPGSVDAELAIGALRTVAVHADDDEFTTMLDRFRHGSTPQEQLRYLYAAAGVSDVGLFDRYLALLATDEIRSQNLAFAYRAALRNLDHGPRAWEAVEQRWDEIRERLPFNAVPRLVEGVTSLSDPDVAARVRAFLDDHPLPSAGQVVHQHLERMDVTVALRRREHGRLPGALTPTEGPL